MYVLQYVFVYLCLCISIQDRYVFLFLEHQLDIEDALGCLERLADKRECCDDGCICCHSKLRDSFQSSLLPSS
jgi:hypothetical protein